MNWDSIRIKYNFEPFSKSFRLNNEWQKTTRLTQETQSFAGRKVCVKPLQLFLWGLMR